MAIFHCAYSPYSTTFLLPAGQQAAKAGSLATAISHLSQAGPYGWLPLTATYLHANQLQSALLLLQQAVAQAYASQTCTAQAHSPATQAHSPAAQAHSSDEAGKAVEWVAAQQLAQQWASLIVSVIKEGTKQDELTLLLFPAADTPQLGVPEVTALRALPAALCLVSVKVIPEA